MTLAEASSKAKEKGLTVYFGYLEGEQTVTYELGFLEPEETCNIGLRCSHPDGNFRWVAMGRGKSWEQAFKDVEAHIH